MANVRKIWFCPYISCDDSTLPIEVAKWLCQKRVIFSSSGRGVYCIRRNHQRRRSTKPVVGDLSVSFEVEAVEAEVALELVGGDPLVVDEAADGAFAPERDGEIQLLGRRAESRPPVEVCGAPPVPGRRRLEARDRRSRHRHGGAQGVPARREGSRIGSRSALGQSGLDAEEQPAPASRRLTGRRDTKPSPPKAEPPP